jgi:hypothetical protein
MTPLELVGAASIGIFATNALVRIVRRSNRSPLTKFEAMIEQAMREAFDAGMLTAADMVTMQGYDETAGKIRKVVELAAQAYNSGK